MPNACPMPNSVDVGAFFLEECQNQFEVQAFVASVLHRCVMLLLMCRVWWVVDDTVIRGSCVGDLSIRTTLFGRRQMSMNPTTARLRVCVCACVRVCVWVRVCTSTLAVAALVLAR